MRSSKSRSRSKANRPRTLGNIVNRVFDSSGPEGKVRGTPQQIIEKYQTLARDAQLSNDRVAAENFLQHAEHYTRLLAEAMREMAAEQEARMAQQGNFNHGGQNNWQNRQNDQRDAPPRSDIMGDDEQPYVAIDSIDGDAPLVDLPESDGNQSDRNARQFQPRSQRRDEGRNNDRGNRGREERPRDERVREDRPRQERHQDRKPAPAPLRFEDGPAMDHAGQVGESAEPAPQPLVFESPADLAAKVAEKAERPKQPRAPRPRREVAPRSVDPASDQPAADPSVAGSVDG